MASDSPRLPFELRASRWYAMEWIYPDPGESRHVSPVFVRKVEPLKSGKGMLWIEFHHALYPEGVQDKGYLLHVAARSPMCLVAEQLDEVSRQKNGRVLLLLEATREWIARNFPNAEFPDGRCDEDVQGFLKRACGIG